MTVAILFGVVFVKGSVRINLQKFFRVTTVILFFVAAQLLVSGLHELSENGVLPSSKQEMSIVGPIVSNEVFFFVTILALAAFMVLVRGETQAARGPSRISGGSAARLSGPPAASGFGWHRCMPVLLCLSCSSPPSLSTPRAQTRPSPATEVSFVNGQAADPAVAGFGRRSAPF